LSVGKKGGLSARLSSSRLWTTTSISPVRRRGAAVALADGSGGLNHVLAAEAVGELELLGRAVLGVEDELRDAVAVAEIDEDQAVAVPPGGVHPSGQGDGLADVLASELAAGVGSMRGAGGVHVGRVPSVIRAASIARCWTDTLAANRERQHQAERILNGLSW